MDVVKVFVEAPVGFEALADDLDPDARRRAAPAGSLDAFLAAGAGPAGDYARAYLAGTHLADDRGEGRRVGLTALDHPDAWLAPLLDWAGDRPWTRLDADGRARAVSATEAADTLRQPAGTRALALGPAPPGALAETARAAHLRDALPALRAVLDAGAAALFPEPAHDGHDWSVFVRGPLGLVAALARHPAPAGVRRFVAPYQRARGEHTFYFEQWALEPPPPWAEPV